MPTEYSGTLIEVVLAITDNAIALSKMARLEGRKCQTEIYGPNQDSWPCNRKCVTFCRTCEDELCDRCAFVVGMDTYCWFCACVREIEIKRMLEEKK